MIRKILGRMSNFDLENFLGSDVLQLTSQIIPSINQSDLIDSVMYKYGAELLNERRVRSAIINTLDDDLSLDFCRRIGLRVNNQNPRVVLFKYFDSPYTVKKSEQLVELLDLPKEFIRVQDIDHREERLLISNEFDEAFKLKPFLHGYQKSVKDNAIQSIESGCHELLIQMPTGSGKTYTALEIMVDFARKSRARRKKYFVWIVDSSQLAEQAMLSFVDAWKSKGDMEMSAFRLFGDFATHFENYDNGVVFCSFDKLYSCLKNREHEFHRSAWYLIENTELLVVDEAHTSVADTYSTCIERFKQNSAKLIGLTATPGRNSVEGSVELARMYSNNIVQFSLPEEYTAGHIRFLQDHGYLARLKFEALETGFYSREHDEELLSKAASVDEKRNRMILTLMEKCEREQAATIVFCCSISHMLGLFLLARSSNLKVEVIYQKTPQHRRIEIIRKLKNKELFLVLNVDLLSTGLDVPTLDRVLLTRPVGSSILVSQIYGRVLRGPKNGGNAENSVLCLKDNLVNFPEIDQLYNGFTEYWGR